MQTARRTAKLAAALAAMLGAMMAAPLLLASSAASTETIREFKVGSWKGGAYASDGAFGFCSAAGTFSNGIMLFVTINEQSDWTLGLMNTAWRLKEGSSYVVGLAIDDAAPVRINARVPGHEMVIVPLDDAALRDRFRRARMLRVDAARQTFEFRLQDTAQMVNALLACVRTKGAPPQTTTPQPSSKTGPQSRQAEAAAMLSKVLADAGIKKFTVSPGDAITSSNADATWSSADMMAGTLIIEPTGSPADIQELQSGAITEHAKACTGSFASRVTPDEERNNLVLQVLTACEENGITRAYFHHAIKRPRGGLYLFSTLTIGDAALARKTDASLRDAILRVIR